MGGSIGGCTCTCGGGAAVAASSPMGAFGAPTGALGGPTLPDLSGNSAVSNDPSQPVKIQRKAGAFQSHGHHMKRIAPENPALADAIRGQVLAAAPSFQNLNDAKAKGFKVLKPGQERIHVRSAKNSDDGKVDPSRPDMLVYQKDARVPGGYRLIGFVLTAPKKSGPPMDLGMGAPHTHSDSTRWMQHVWLNTDNLRKAFADNAPRG